MPEGPAHAGMTAALGLPVDDLFVREDRLQLLAPPDGDLGLVREAAVVESSEDPLSPAVVLHVAGRELSIPVVAQPDRLQLTPVGLDVLPRGLLRMPPGGDGVLLGREPERVVPHGMKHVVALHPLASRDDVRPDVAHRVPDVQARPGGVGEHVEHVVLRLGGVEVGVARIRGPEGPLLGPASLPPGLDRARVVSVHARRMPARDPRVKQGTRRAHRETRAIGAPAARPASPGTTPPPRGRVATPGGWWRIGDLNP